jgi:hypothetical protein
MLDVLLMRDVSKCQVAPAVENVIETPPEVAILNFFRPNQLQVDRLV